MVVLDLPWFVDLGSWPPLRKTKKVELEESLAGGDLRSGPRSGRFRVLGLDTRALTAEETRHALVGPPSFVDTQTVHALAVAERACDLLEALTGLATRWPEEDLLYLQSHAQSISAIPSGGASYGLYLPERETVRFSFVPNGPAVCLSHDVVVHEVCHGFLDGTKGWLNANVETRATTESLGDVLAMLSAGRLVEVRRWCLEEASGDLGGTTNVLSRFSEIPGTTFHIRDLTERVKRSEAGADKYELSKVLSSALYRGFAARAESLGGGQLDEGHVKQAVFELSKAVFAGVANLPKNKVTLEQVALAALMNADDGLATELGEAFVAHEVLEALPT